MLCSPDRRPLPVLRGSPSDYGYAVAEGGVLDLTRALDDPAHWDFAGLERTLKTFEAGAPEVDRVVVSAENSIPFGVVAALIEAARGADCPMHESPATWTTARCRFPKVVVEAGAG